MSLTNGRFFKAKFGQVYIHMAAYSRQYYEGKTPVNGVFLNMEKIFRFPGNVLLNQSLIWGCAKLRVHIPVLLTY